MTSKFDFFLNILVSLDYSGIMYSFSQGGTGVPCTPLCDLMVPSIDLFCRGLIFV